MVLTYSRRRSNTSLRSSIADLFLSRFTLTPLEVAALTSREVPVGPDLFAAMSRVIDIRRDCQSVFAFSDEDSARVGHEIMAATNEQLEAGYAKVHRWCQAQFRAFTRDSHLEVGETLQEAVRRLRERPALME
jgi:conserved oligomeric Golgi complex subunit 6